MITARMTASAGAWMGGVGALVVPLLLLVTDIKTTPGLSEGLLAEWCKLRRRSVDPGLGTRYSTFLRRDSLWKKVNPKPIAWYILTLVFVEWLTFRYELMHSELVASNPVFNT